MKSYRPGLLGLITLAAVCTGSPAMAALQRVDLRNETTVTHIFLFAGDGLAAPALDFVGLDLRSGFRDWSVDVYTSTVAVVSGPARAPLTGRLRLSFNAAQPAADLHWAEVVFDGANFVIGGSGARSYARDTATWTDSPVFSSVHANFVARYFAVPPSAVVPVPAPLVLILPALAVLAAVRRRASSDV